MFGKAQPSSCSVSYRQAPHPCQYQAFDCGDSCSASNSQNSNFYLKHRSTRVVARYNPGPYRSSPGGKKFHHDSSGGNESGGGGGGGEQSRVEHETREQTKSRAATSVTRRIRRRRSNGRSRRQRHGAERRELIAKSVRVRTTTSAVKHGPLTRP